MKTATFVTALSLAVLAMVAFSGDVPVTAETTVPDAASTEATPQATGVTHPALTLTR